MTLRLSFERGTLRIEDSRGDDIAVEVPHAIYDERSGTLRAHAMHYSEITAYLDGSRIPYDDDAVRQYGPVPQLRMRTQLRDYQSDAVSRWRAAQMRGCVILPTGSGKTMVGAGAICAAAVPALIVVPTIDLLDQWAGFLQRNTVISGYADSEPSASPDVGRLGGGSDDLRPITIATYDSAYIRAPEIGSMFGLVVFDEVHHLPAPGYSMIAEQCVAPFRLGLTATFERGDGLHSEIPRLAGGIVYVRGAEELAAKRHLAPYDMRRIRVRLADDERAEYSRCRSEFVAGLRKLGMRSESMYNLRRLIMISNRNPGARAALLARNRANEIAFNAGAKITELARILREDCRTSGYAMPRKTLIFTQNNKMAYKISDEFLMPIITHKTPKDERADALDGFRTGRYAALVTSRVLDEGIDVPDAEVGVIVSGTGSGREAVQRLGRLLRPKYDGARALLIEMVSDGTRETGSSARRAAALRRSLAGKKRGAAKKDQAG